MNKKYIEINSNYSIALFSPFLNEENYENNKKKHEIACSKFYFLGCDILKINDKDRTLFIYHKEMKCEHFFREVVDISKYFDVSSFFIQKNGLKTQSNEFILNILSKDYLI